MRRFSGWCLVAVLAASLGVSAQAAEKKAARENTTFGTLVPASEVAVRLQAATWLKDQDKYDRAQFDEIWNKKDVATLDRLVKTFELADPAAKKLMDEARDPNAAAPTAVPEVLKDSKKPMFFRGNLALAYAKALSNRKVYEEAHETLGLFKPEQVIDPATFLFHKAVAEHAMMKKQLADETIVRLLDDVPAAPERYKMVAALMHFDMASWQEKDLGAIGRKMDNIQRRLDLSRGGRATQKLQKEVVARLDEIIKELENQAKSGNCPNGGNCPSGGQGQKPGNPNGIRSSSPAADSKIPSGAGPGTVDPKKLQERAAVWGKLPPKERVKAMLDDAKEIKDPRYRKVIEDYARELAKQIEGK
jgi:hypothetical protein